VRVLLVEDDRKVASFIQKGLEEEGFTVELAMDGKEGLERVKASSYDVVLLDLMIPEIDGLELLRLMRDGGIETPVLILTAKDTKEDVVKGLNAGSDDYLTKPFSFDELLARIRALLRRAKKASSSLLRHGGLTLNPFTRRLQTEKGEIDLTEREFLIMEYMMRNAGRPISRKEIAEYVWPNRLESSNIVDVYINFLRKKLETLSDRRYIHTLRGVGYIFGEER